MKLDELRKKVFEYQKSQDMLRLSVLRYLLSMVKNREIELRPEKKEIDDEEVARVFDRVISQTEESISEYKNAGRQDLVDKESAELEVMKEFRNYVKEQPAE